MPGGRDLRAPAGRPATARWSRCRRRWSRTRPAAASCRRWSASRAAAAAGRSWSRSPRRSPAGLEDPKQAADLWVQIAFWYESGLGMPDEAANAARAALNLAPNHGGALALLEDLYKRQRNWDATSRSWPQARSCATDDPYKLRDAYREVVRYEPHARGRADGPGAHLRGDGRLGGGRRRVAQADRGAAAGPGGRDAAAGPPSPGRDSQGSPGRRARRRGAAGRGAGRARAARATSPAC